MTNKQVIYNKVTIALKEKMRNDYVQGIASDNGFRVVRSIEEIAETYGVSKNTLYKIAQKENWKHEQEAFHEKFIADLDNKRRKEFVQESINFDKKSLQVAKDIMGHIGKIIETHEKSHEQIKPHNLVALSSAANNAQKVAKLCLGESTENMNVNTNVNESEIFREAVELLDTIAEQKRTKVSAPVH